MTDTANSSARADESEVRCLYDRLMEGWNVGSGAGFAGVFAPNAHFVAFDGTHLIGRDEIARSHQQLFDKWMKGSRLVGVVEQVQFLRTDVAVVHAIGNTVMRNKRVAARERASAQTLVATRAGDTWQISAFHNTRVRPIGHNAATFLTWSLFDRIWRLLRLSTKSRLAGTQ